MKQRHSSTDSFKAAFGHYSQTGPPGCIIPLYLMGTKTIAVLITIAFSVIGVLGDYFLKLASEREQSLRTNWFYLGFALYASTAFGWVFVMKHLKLATISVLYSVSLVLLLTAIGVVLFQESLNYFEVIGIVFAVVSLVLLMRFA
jgi:small multidrug resistance pump